MLTYAYVCMHTYIQTDAHKYAEIRVNLQESVFSSFLMSSGVELRSWWQAPLPTDPSHSGTMRSESQGLLQMGRLVKQFRAMILESDLPWFKILSFYMCGNLNSFISKKKRESSITRGGGCNGLTQCPEQDSPWLTAADSLGVLDTAVRIGFSTITEKEGWLSMQTETQKA